MNEMETQNESYLNSAGFYDRVFGLWAASGDPTRAPGSYFQPSTPVNLNGSADATLRDVVQSRGAMGANGALIVVVALAALALLVKV
jgi:hypothetical protein